MDSPTKPDAAFSETLNYIVQFLHNEGFYLSEAALVGEIENRYPETSSAGASPDHLPGLAASGSASVGGYFEFGPGEHASAAAVQHRSKSEPGDGGASESEAWHAKEDTAYPVSEGTSAGQHSWDHVHASSSRAESASSGKRSLVLHPGGSDIDEYSDDEDPGYAREDIRGQEAFVARELDHSDDENSAGRSAYGYHRFDAKPMVREEWDTGEQGSDSDGQGSSYFSGEVVARDEEVSPLCSSVSGGSGLHVVLTEEVNPYMQGGMPPEQASRRSLATTAHAPASKALSAAKQAAVYHVQSLGEALKKIAVTPKEKDSQAGSSRASPDDSITLATARGTSLQPAQQDPLSAAAAGAAAAQQESAAPLAEPHPPHGVHIDVTRRTTSEEDLSAPVPGTPFPRTPKETSSDMEDDAPFSFPVTPPSEPAAPTAVFGSWPSFKHRKKSSTSVQGTSSGYTTEDEMGLESSKRSGSLGLGHTDSEDMGSKDSRRTLIKVAHDLEGSGAGHSSSSELRSSATGAGAHPASAQHSPGGPGSAHSAQAGNAPHDPPVSLKKLDTTLSLAPRRGEEAARKARGAEAEADGKPDNEDEGPAALELTQPVSSGHDLEGGRRSTSGKAASAGRSRLSQASQEPASTSEEGVQGSQQARSSREDPEPESIVYNYDPEYIERRYEMLDKVKSSQQARSSREDPEPESIVYNYDPEYIERRYEMLNLKIIHRRRRTGFEETKDFPIRVNDLIAGRYQVMDFLGSAAFSKAVQALDIKTGMLVCLKIIKNNKDYFDQSLDEIKLLKYVNDADPEDEFGMLRLYDYFYYKEHLFLVCELLRANLYEFQKYNRENGDEPYFTLARIQRITRQVLHSLAFMHSLGLIHSDLKPENILIKSYSRCEVKVIDLGSSCFTTDHLSSYVQSRSYRAPEVILGLPYDQKIDVWSFGCILAELLSGVVLFQNESLATLLARLEGIMGPVPRWMVRKGRYAHRFYTRAGVIYERSARTGRYERLKPKRSSIKFRLPGSDEGFLDFLRYLLAVDPFKRPTAEEALSHPWLTYPYPPIEPPVAVES
ncbi:hypothetical protein WJX72_004019 [[Myrmecia] bisecta]|uniref:Protein kinase domain-containing protein n=1 Tax=[Myrmecia] bisecta TaxID=41462 RepID=A0AAW1P2G2_9CHLO